MSIKSSVSFFITNVSKENLVACKVSCCLRQINIWHAKKHWLRRNFTNQKVSGPTLKIQERNLCHTTHLVLFLQIESNRWPAVLLYTVFLETAIWVEFLFNVTPRLTEYIALNWKRAAILHEEVKVICKIMLNKKFVD